jgi:hypothetical protein
MTFLSVYQSYAEFVKIRWYNYNSLNSQVAKCDVLQIPSYLYSEMRELKLFNTSHFVTWLLSEW